MIEDKFEDDFTRIVRTLYEWNLNFKHKNSEKETNNKPVYDKSTICHYEGKYGSLSFNVNTGELRVRINDKIELNKFDKEICNTSVINERYKLFPSSIKMISHMRKNESYPPETKYLLYILIDKKDVPVVYPGTNTIVRLQYNLKNDTIKLYKLKQDINNKIDKDYFKFLLQSMKSSNYIGMHYAYKLANGEAHLANKNNLTVDILEQLLLPNGNKAL